MKMQGNFTRHEWETLNVFQLASLHVMRNKLALYCPDLTEWVMSVYNRN